LRAQYRWCLTGTPIYNVLEDFGSLVGFLGVYPFDKAATFNSRIGIPVKNRTTQGLETLQKLVQGVCLRRTKNAIRHDLQLPNFHKALCRVELSTTERQDYEALKKNYSAILSTGTDAKMAAGSTTRIFLTMLRLRQFCDHGLDMLPNDVRELLKTSAEPKAYAECLSNGIEYCTACYKGLDEKAEYGALFLRDCGHVMCPSCEKKVKANTIEPDGECIACATQIKQQSMEFQKYRPSSKVLALLRNLSVERDQASLHPIKRQAFRFHSWEKVSDRMIVSCFPHGPLCWT
jgi:SNF2 family DNA or RNA helicase